ncbi:exodeoxyribonuclease VII small subunit [Patescibacteria group bacterium]|nr:exodeoxyribonuclease VII small subunit [Patescibacteria group bacterium]MBU1663400.1 exodeoxyribonuclease VII small subunit [Patescibacteria group bacterium]MBU1933757.1 exodeoxyribonuclease VII small subunit [Patescibacteria group bacterium]MBU2008036.1 exodeoxyribonuclease VII small subunit [Patescibacteria group bacterium]MBU2233730.1 exodeoxyribonuclease VII small subunit [Patescibacteria group bacterium]
MPKNSLKNSLKKLKEIIDWFDAQEEVDVEAGLEKVKEGVSLIKGSRAELKKLENEFEKVKQELGEGPDEEEGSEEIEVEEPVDPESIPL